MTFVSYLLLCICSDNIAESDVITTVQHFFIAHFIFQIILPKLSSEDKKLSPSMSDPGRSDRSSIKVPSKHIIPAESIVVNKELGAGEFGTVQQGVWTNEDGDRVSVYVLFELHNALASLFTGN